MCGWVAVDDDAAGAFADDRVTAQDHRAVGLVAVALRLVAQVARMPLQRVIAGAVPFLWPLGLALLVITFVPVLSTWLPNLVVK